MRALSHLEVFWLDAFLGAVLELYRFLNSLLLFLVEPVFTCWCALITLSEIVQFDLSIMTGVKISYSMLRVCGNE